MRWPRFLRRVPDWAWPTSTLLCAAAAFVGLWVTSSWLWGVLLLAAGGATGALGAWHDTRRGS